MAYYHDRYMIRIKGFQSPQTDSILVSRSEVSAARMIFQNRLSASIRLLSALAQVDSSF